MASKESGRHGAFTQAQNYWLEEEMKSHQVEKDLEG